MVANFIQLSYPHSLVPESPRWLILKGHAEEALQVLQTLAVCNGTKVLPEVKLKKGVATKQSTTSSSVFDLFSFSTICSRTIVMMTCW